MSHQMEEKPNPGDVVQGIIKQKPRKANMNSDKQTDGYESVPF